MNRDHIEDVIWELKLDEVEAAQQRFLLNLFDVIHLDKTLGEFAALSDVETKSDVLKDCKKETDLFYLKKTSAVTSFLFELSLNRDLF